MMNEGGALSARGARRAWRRVKHGRGCDGAQDSCAQGRIASAATQAPDIRTRWSGDVTDLDEPA